MSYDFNWSLEALCLGQPSSRFFEDYENDSEQAAQTDLMCNSCPVQRTCLGLGLKNDEEGCWGGVYLERGRISDGKSTKNNFNKHKTSSDWNALWTRLSHTTQM